eukprot:8642352-Heterocapsa_arctica.AAC.1
MPNKSIERLWGNIQPDYQGKVGQAVVDLGITHRVHTRASFNKGKRVADTSKVVEITQALALAVSDNVTIIKTGGQSEATYGVAVDPFTQGELNALRGRFAEAFWPNEYVACKVTGLLLVDIGELEPGIAIVKQIWVNWLRQFEGGIPAGVAERWGEYSVYTGPTRRPVNDYRRQIHDLGWTDNSIDSIIYEKANSDNWMNGQGLSEMGSNEPDN